MKNAWTGASAANSTKNNLLIAKVKHRKKKRKTNKYSIDEFWDNKKQYGN